MPILKKVLSVVPYCDAPGTPLNLREIFEKYEELSTGKFSLIMEVDKLHARPDICALLLLDRIVPGSTRLLAAVGHDTIFLGVDCAVLAQCATEANILTLIRCGVRYEPFIDALTLYC